MSGATVPGTGWSVRGQRQGRSAVGALESLEGLPLTRQPAGLLFRFLPSRYARRERPHGRLGAEGQSHAAQPLGAVQRREGRCLRRDFGCNKHVCTFPFSTFFIIFLRMMTLQRKRGKYEH